MGLTYNDWISMNDAGILQQIGRFIKSTRLNQNKSQEVLAQEAGLNRWTIVQIEKGESVTLITLVQVLRALDAIYVLEHFEVGDEISPIEYARIKKQERQRASRSTKSSLTSNNEKP
jgi:DNA-binding XRE family transcriptional regulator